ncbi:MAG TPA: VOC family protein [Acidimicrobiales bacterium]|nr:VOC family protein [Acidimicrobiales bacterium]
MANRGVISHVDLNVTDLEASIRFYALVLGHLGFERHDLPDGRCSWSLDYADGAVLGIEVRPPALPAPRDRHERYSPGLDHLAFHAASRADVDVLYEELVAAGHVVADPPTEYDYAPGYYAVAFDDPSGIRLEVVHDPTTNPSPAEAPEGRE